MHCINQRESSHRMRRLNCPTVIVNRAERVASRTESYDLRFLRYQPLKVWPVQLSRFGIHLRNPQGYSAFDNQGLPWGDVGVVFEFSDDDLITSLHVSAERSRQLVNHRSRIGAEDDF